MNFFRSLLTLSFLAIISCSTDTSFDEPKGTPDPVDPPIGDGYQYKSIPPYSQRQGDANTGYEYLIQGDYMSSGIPYDIYVLVNGESNSNVLNRTGKNATIPHDLNAVELDSDVTIVAPNCLQCHSSRINNELVLGLGNQTLDFTVNRAADVKTLTSGINLLYGSNSKEAEAYETFKNSLEVLGERTITKVRGVNPADKTTVVLTAYRDKNTLEQLKNPQVVVSDEVIPSDIPAWWLLKKKNALFYHAIGRKDFCRSMITMILATLKDVEKAKEVDEKMKDILAYIENIEAPVYPFDINNNLATQGATIFDQNCATCHGTYGGSETYPNKLVALSTVGTDATLSNYYTQPSAEVNYFIDWFNTGWFGTGSNSLEVVTEGGYIAPPLDGIWATAPYFHNGSVPTIEDVLNSKNRPVYWKRSFLSSDYNTDKIGWNYETTSSQLDINTYDSTLKGYGNGGHTFGDDLTDNERAALLEYLKTL